MFSFAQILISAIVGGIASAVTVVALRRSAGAGRTALALGAVVAFSIVLWRSAANTAALNDDPMPFVSPNDVLCPIVTYVTLGLYAAVRRSDRDAGWPALRTLLTVVSLVVNVVTI